MFNIYQIMNRFLLRIFMPFLLFSSYDMVAQKAQNVQHKVVSNKSNLDSPLTAKEKNMIIEAYGIEAAEKYVFNKPQRLKDIKDILRNRVALLVLSNKNLDKLQKLSEVPLFDSYRSIERDVIIDKNNFNPLKYIFDFYGKENQYISVDNTQLVIFITSQFN